MRGGGSFQLSYIEPDWVYSDRAMLRYVAWLFLSQFDGVPGTPGKTQNEGQQDQGEVKGLGAPLALTPLSGSAGLPSGSSLAFLELHQTS